MKLAFAYIKSDAQYWNAGDEASCAAQYFPEFSDCEVVSLNEVSELPAGLPVIIGGGGILAFPEFISQTARQRPTIIWGAGLNNALPFDPTPVVEALKLCKLVGIRDRKFARDYGFVYAPCASCVSMEFLRSPADRGVLFYGHAWSGVLPPSGIDFYAQWNNMDRSRTPTETIAEFRRASVIVTDSYHGAYWGVLAHRPTFLWRVEQLRFWSGLPVMPPVLHTEEELKLALEFSPHPTDNNNIYRDCLDRTERFRQRVNNFLQTL